MWRRATNDVSGSNDTPLGNRRRFGPTVPEENTPVRLAAVSPSAFPSSRPAPQQEAPKAPSEPVDPNAPRKRRSRWGDTKTDIPGLPTAISAQGVPQAQLDNYAIHLRLEEINRKLRMNDFVPPERERSPSPPPTYDAHGRRTNIREVRYRKKLEDERMRLVDRAMKNDPNFRPPVEYHQAKRSQRPQEKVYIPVKEFPEINFFGLLVGPRGNSLKKMERDSGAKISIRGKGSVKEGKARPEAFADDAEEDLHCLVTGEDMEKVLTCVRLINRVIETAASTPEGQNDHKRNQLRELAALNGTLRDDENQVCQNCGNIGHRKYDCPEQRNFTANIICRICGSAGHMARDCAAGRGGAGGPTDGGFGGPPGIGGPPGGTRGPAGFDSEYASLMAELGEGGASGGGGGGGGGGAPVGAIGWTGGAAPSGPDVTASGTNVPPWRRPEMWIQSAQPQQNRPPQGGFQPPQGYNGQGWGAGQQQPPQGGYPQGGPGGQFGQQGYYPQQQQQQAQGGFDYAAYYAQYGQQQQQQAA